MQNRFRHIQWNNGSEVSQRLAAPDALWTVHPMPSGLEAEVVRIAFADIHYAMKIWNKSSKPDAQYQYDLLSELRHQGLSVSQPFGSGIDGMDHPVLLTSFDGEAVKKVNPEMIAEIAKLLSQIHNIQMGERSFFRKYDFIPYFYPGIDQFPDLHDRLQSIVTDSRLKQERLIHGDFNLGNIVEKDGRYTVIDWTNGQLGDHRYDLAWAHFLLKVYTSERIASQFLSAYTSDIPLDLGEYQAFEAMACLRWIFLNRTAELPKRSNTVKRVKNIIKQNAYLQGVGV
ncbi:aminoglycoside phosphotransferase family protein [Cohnella pontilimi]|uniref:Aminoglycoside phosphotransferase family protein n=1 Tax=Cohnella pontilimi TaxID=2564100 RepID=A0A4U0FGD7_9BACL|nr:aminoglycoside phosphotransferase family protein [Cohnella pontilimi]TJY43948.1 aminoglycoside phosphotransferase family protein [Cohnella pontilimi]